MTTQDAGSGCIIIADGNMKGGVGKTTTTSELAAALHKIGARVLVAGKDAQMSVESRFGRKALPKGFKTFYELLVEADEETGSTAKLITEDMVRGCILPTFYDEEMIFFNPERNKVENSKQGPMLMPISNRGSKASNADFILRGSVPGWERKLRDALELVKKDFDYILIDCPPAIGTLTTMAFVAADYIFIPLQPEKASAEGMAELTGFIYSLTLDMNPGLKIAGAFFSMVQSNWRAHNAKKEEMRDPKLRQSLTRVFGANAEPFYIFDQEIRRNSALLNSSEDNSIMVMQQPRSEYTRDYWFLLDELLQRIGGRAQGPVHTYVERLRAAEAASATTTSGK